MTDENKSIYSPASVTPIREIREAATVIVARQREQLEVLLVRRHGKSAFLGGAHVFPGGRVDETDSEVPVTVEDRERCAQRLEPTPPATSVEEEKAIAIHVAACRELFEESGILLARDEAGATAHPDSKDRAQILAGTLRFSDLLLQRNLTIDLSALHYWAHWVTPSGEKRRYDTRFFFVEVPDGQEASTDDKETTEQIWITPDAALEANRESEMFLAPPTQRVLEELVDTKTVAATIEQSRARRIGAILPKITLIEGEIAAVLPWDPLYDTLEGEGLPHQDRSLDLTPVTEMPEHTARSGRIFVVFAKP